MMKIIRLLLLSFASLFIVVLIISLFIPSHVRISRATEINAPVDDVRALLVSPAAWKAWYPNLDSTRPYLENGEIKGVVSEVNGDNRRLLLDSVSDAEVKTLYIVEGRKPVSSGWTLHHSGIPREIVTVQWYMNFDLRWYPWEKFASLVFDKSYGPMMELGLSNLKKQSETDRPSQMPADTGSKLVD